MTRYIPNIAAFFVFGILGGVAVAIMRDVAAHYDLSEAWPNGVRAYFHALSLWAAIGFRDITPRPLWDAFK